MVAQSRSAAEFLAEFDRLQFPIDSIGSTPAAFRKAGSLAGMDAIDAFLAVDGKAVEGDYLIMELLRSRSIPTKIAEGLLSSVADVWPNDRWLKPDAHGYGAQLKRIGKPMVLEFEDLLGGKKISTKDGTSPLTLWVYWS